MSPRLAPNLTAQRRCVSARIKGRDRSHSAPRLRVTYRAPAAGAAPVSYALAHDGNGTESRRSPDGGKSPEGSSYAAGCLLLLWVGSVGETGPQNLPSRWACTAAPVRNLRPRCQQTCCAGGSPGGPCPSVHGCPAPLQPQEANRRVRKRSAVYSRSVVCGPAHAVSVVVSPGALAHKMPSITMPPYCHFPFPRKTFLEPVDDL